MRLVVALDGGFIGRMAVNEVGVIASSPQKSIAQGTDWRFFYDLKKALKG